MIRLEVNSLDELSHFNGIILIYCSRIILASGKMKTELAIKAKRKFRLHSLTFAWYDYDY